VSLRGVERENDKDRLMKGEGVKKPEDAKHQLSHQKVVSGKRKGTREDFLISSPKYEQSQTRRRPKLYKKN